MGHAVDRVGHDGARRIIRPTGLVTGGSATRDNAPGIDQSERPPALPSIAAAFSGHRDIADRYRGPPSSSACRFAR